MTKLQFFILFFTILAPIYGTQPDLFPPQPSPITPPHTSTTTTKPTPKPTTHPTTTPTPPTPPPTTPPTPAPTTPPTPAPTTPPTPAPTTPPTPSPTTPPTPAPTTPPTPAPTPGPVPDPIMGNWSVKFNNSDRVCVVVNMAVQLEILDVNLKTRINVPANATCSGSCGKEKDVFLLAWNKDKNNLEFDFTKSNTSKFELDSVYVNLTVVSNGTETYQLVHSKPEFATPLANSYKCKKIQTLNLTEVNSNKTIAYLHMSNVQFQAFSNNSGQAFASAMDCESSITTDIVPIVVGCVLATLVVMILIAYLIGRRRCQARGYNSMYSRETMSGLLAEFRQKSKKH